ncbi:MULTISPECIES: hypothetical protein [Nitrospirillum]|uniref:HEAT repeat protein n=1 Tax=Nitrospirillum amazonense TaxID=28077 RepID=A0A560F5V9_9PROT|nr:hypothetical protein [Nitrospirillum amazonense]MEC4593111.1 hypothetical protein [Nitrospirillum amazonense]TWB17006.1 hypothetical protein FBZ88_1272 [Nitrospirillum amazonense]
MTTHGKDASAAALIEEFRTQVKRYFHADIMGNRRTMKACLPKMGNAVQALDTVAPEGRMALVPLLKDADDGVRVYAAAYLFGRLPEEARAVWDEVLAGSKHPSAYLNVVSFKIIADWKPDDFIKAFE